MVEAKSVTWDVVDVDTQTALAACAEGILETIDWAKLGLDRSKFIGGDQFDCAVPTIVYSTIIAYDTDKLNPGPTSIADLFDLQKFPGKRALQKNPFVNLEWALIADGVPTADVYKVLNTPEGVDRAFKKLDTIKKDIVWWEAGAQPPQLLADGAGRHRVGLERPHLQCGQEDRQALQDRVGPAGPRLGLVGDSEGRRRRSTLAYKFISFASQPDKHGRPDEVHLLRPGQQGCGAEDRRGGAAGPADRA